MSQIQDWSLTYRKKWSAPADFVFNPNHYENQAHQRKINKHHHQCGKQKADPLTFKANFRPYLRLAKLKSPHSWLHSPNLCC